MKTYLFETELAKEWDIEKNGLLPKDLLNKSGKKFWWKCKKCNLSWETKISSRTAGKTGCPFCAGKKACADNCLATLRPDIAKEWDFEKNGSLTPNNVTAKSSKKVWWKGFCGHSWQASIKNRNTDNNGCPFCTNQKVDDNNCLAHLNHLLSEEWDFEKNGSLTPNNVTSNSGKKIWWKGKCGHSWQAVIRARNTDNTGCPFCTNQKVDNNNCLAHLNPLLSEEWDELKNGSLTPKDVTSNSNKKVWWKGKCEHFWFATVNSRSNGTGCPFCAGNKVCSKNCLASVLPDIAKEWDELKNGSLTPDDVISGSTKKFWWLGKCGHSWLASAHSRKQ